jgi:hypothetical protein
LGVARELPRPVLLTIDDADAADAETAAALELLARTIARSPERAGRLLLVTSGQSRGEVELGGFGEREVEALLVALFPGRRVGARVAGPLADAAQGLAGRVLGRLGALAAQGALTVTAAAVHVDAEAAAAVGEELSRGAADALVPLDSGLRDAAGLLAHARAPVPMHVFEPEAQALVTAGVAVRIGAGAGARVAMRAGSTREAGRGVGGSARGVRGVGAALRVGRRRRGRGGGRGPVVRAGSGARRGARGGGGGAGAAAGAGSGPGRGGALGGRGVAGQR